MSHDLSVLAVYGRDHRVGALVADFPPGLVVGRVTRVDRGRVSVVTESGVLRPRPRDALAVGDWVGVDLAIDCVAAVAPRWSALTRHAAGLETVGQTLAANIDVVVVVQALNKALNVRRLERELVFAWESGAVPLVVLTKADMCADADAEAAAARDAASGVDVVAVSAVTGWGINKLVERLGVARTFVIIGASGVGKSTLINRLAGAELQDTGGIRLTDGRGRHTTTAAQLVVVSGGPILIDTPGLRELALWDGDNAVNVVFADIEELSLLCRFGDCQHASEPDCAVRDAVDRERIESWRKLRRELERVAGDRAGWQKAEANRARRNFGRALKRQPYRP